MHRTHLIALLDAHRATDDAEAADVAHIKHFVADHPDCFGKTNPRGHITGSAYIVDSTGRFLMTHHAKLGRWLQVGGHSDAHEHDPLQTALREAVEESGLTDLRPLSAAPIDIDVHRIPERRRRRVGQQASGVVEPAHDHLDLRYALITATPEAICITPESTDLQWFAFEALAALDLDAASMRAVRKVRRLLDAAPTPA